MKILILALSGIGDALMFTPALTLMRRNFPEAQIDAVVMFRGVKDIYDRTALLDNVVYFDFMKQGYLNSIRFLSTLRHKNYDYSFSVYPSNRKEYNVISWVIGANTRGAVSYKRMDKSNLGFLNNCTIKEDDNLHNVEENVLLTAKALNYKYDSIPSLHFPLITDDTIHAEKELNRLKITKADLLIGFHPGCSLTKNHIKRRWEPEKFADLAKMLIVRLKAKVILLGGPEEADLRSDIIKLTEDEHIYSPNTTNLAQSAALIKMCNAFVTNDSSLMHVASAMKQNVVAVIGPTNKNYIHPWKTNYRIASLNKDCAPCFFYSPKPLTCNLQEDKFSCIQNLTTEQVYKEVTTILGM